MSDQNVVALLNQVLNRLSVIESRLDGGNASKSTPAASSGQEGELPRAVKGFDSYAASSLDPFVAACNKLGGDAQTAGNIVKGAWEELRKLIVLASACKEPAPAAFQPLLGGMSAKIKELSSLVKRNEWEKHTKTCSEGIGCLSWVAVKPAPRDFIESFVGGSDYWANTIRKEYRTTNPDQIAFCDTFKSLLTELMAYVKEYHTTGLSWNPKGVDVSAYKEGAVPAAAAPVAEVKKAVPAASASAAPSGNLFSELNKEGAITSGLKKVTKDMQTWRSEYKGGDAPAPAAKAPAAKSPTPAAAVALKGPPKLEFQAGPSKWLVEYYSDKDGVASIEIKDKKETVYVYGCVGATINVTGKCKSIILDGCKKTKLNFDTAMASVEVVNCQRINVVCRDTCAAVAIDKTDGIVVTLPKSSLHTEITASKSSEMNVSFPDEHGDMIEKPIPEQYIHRIKGNTITADVSDLYSH